MKIIIIIIMHFCSIISKAYVYSSFATFIFTLLDLRMGYHYSLAEQLQ